MSQSTSNILMIRPVSFGYNEQTAESNAFQTRDADQKQVQASALAEFDGFVNILRDNGVNVIVIEDTLRPRTPDSIFPNNWVSFHANGSTILYPMQAKNRRYERRNDILYKINEDFQADHLVHITEFEKAGKFLEGTGSMVLDRVNKITYACLSPRTNEEVLAIFCKQAGYRSVIFHAFDENGLAIYHTNVLMCIGSKFAAVCLDSIVNYTEKELVIKSLKDTGKEIIDISLNQMNHFAGNMLEVKNKNGEILIVMSQNAYNSLTDSQKITLSKYGKLVYADIHTIENNGGGSARCMMAEVHLPLRIFPPLPPVPEGAIRKTVTITKRSSR